MTCVYRSEMNQKTASIMPVKKSVAKPTLKSAAAGTSHVKRKGNICIK